jgi:hypothetical protein
LSASHELVHEELVKVSVRADLIEGWAAACATVEEQFDKRKQSYVDPLGKKHVAISVIA